MLRVLVCALTVFLVGRTLCVHQYDRLLRLRGRNLRPPLPSMFLSNVRSLRNKTDEFLCNRQTKRDYKD